ncbi:phosphoadenosine phosphosulfate reductase [Methylobacterium phyllostachyos]|uniref:Adenosine 5'-phosphosulfate reductase n=1 Tax=Methylobacterium phyllostachyos TaxID=582672 RepID=A0A1H0BH67_9HYPH|nr:phosphoadenylyl-sulfate reductase [Methylobacterium phyllostachyos]SDN44971.1 phosphoadenosine phosphosulfate reductase [Methylobacterium phyllostachyos]
MTRPDRQTAEALAERLSGLDLTSRLHLIAAEIPGRLVFTTSLGVEDQALTHALAMAKLAAGQANGQTMGRVEIVTLDTGRLFAETYDTWTETESAYGIRITAYAPERVAVEDFVRDEGINGFRRSVAARQACCGFRKVEPLGRALEGASGWLTGLRAGQSANRAETPLAELDAVRGLIKLNPLADWTRAQVDSFVRENFVPYNVLHDRGFPSIGCAPCTRAVKLGEPERAGRWWWEQEDKKECGLHVGRPGASVQPGQEAAAFETIQTETHRQPEFAR